MKKKTIMCLLFSLACAGDLRGDERNNICLPTAQSFFSNEDLQNAPGENSCSSDNYQCFQEVDQTRCCGSFFSQLKYSAKVRIAPFLPLSSRFRKIYGDAIPNYQIEGGVTYLNRFQAWMNFDWVYKKGQSHRLDDYTTIHIGNLSIGLNFLLDLSKSFRIYAGLGPSFGRVSLHNGSTQYHKKATKYPVGLVVKSGLVYYFNCHYFLDVFVDYLYQPTSFKNNVDIGGFKTGVGIGIDF